MPNLPQYIGTDIATRDLIDVQKILSEVGGCHDYVVILPRLRVGGAEKYAAMLVETITGKMKSTVLLITTDSWPVDDMAALTNPILSGLKTCRVASLFEPLRRSWRQDQLLALLVQRTKANALFVINSELGLKMVAGYGRAISTSTTILCAFFSESPLAVGAPYSARYLRSVIPNAFVFADNSLVLAKFVERLGPTSKERMVCIPQPISSVGDRTFDALLRQRLSARPTNRIQHPRLLWVSRWERFKMPELLLAIAKAREDMEIVAYGPGYSDLSANTPSNFSHKGMMPVDAQEVVNAHDIFVFTSMFEGMPNIVMEMVAGGIPVVASDVGGLRETFDDNAVEFVNMGNNQDVLARSFLEAIDKIMRMTPSKLEKRLRAARAQLLARHSQEGFERALCALLRKRSDD